jgi:N,N-dimethylformamidase
MGRIVINSSQYEPKPIIGYADQISVAPGDSLNFMVSLDGASTFDAQMVRLIHGDMHGAGPGFKEEEIDATANGTFAAFKQDTYPGSCIEVNQSQKLDHLASVTVQALIWPTTPCLDREQVILSKYDDDKGVGWMLYITPAGELAFRISHSSGSTDEVVLPGEMTTTVWYLVSASFDDAGKTVRLARKTVRGTYSTRVLYTAPGEDNDVVVEKVTTADLPDTTGIPMFIAAKNRLTLSNGRHVHADVFNGKIDRPRVAQRVLSDEEITRSVFDPQHVPGIIASWAFEANLTSAGVKDITHVIDSSVNRIHGTTRNMPVRAMTGHNWDGSEYCYRHAVDQYGAIHFHDDDISDCMWEPTVSWTVPDHVQSGVYALRVFAMVEDVREEDYLVFFVRNSPGVRRSKILYVAPTASYLAYANDQFAADAPFVEALAGAVPHMGEMDLARHQHREFGMSCYDVHSDGSGVCYSTWLRPILTVRPKYRHSMTNVWQFNADMHLIDWFDRMGYPVDVITDHDLHREGHSALDGYKLVVTGTHPEYYSGGMLDALQSFVEHDGGRIMYLGGNGFYWVTAFHPDDPRIIEVRRAHGTEAWSGEPGQQYMSFTGEFGGLWRHRGRAPQKLVGTGFIAQGMDRSSYYRRNPDSFDPEAQWIMEGVGDDEKIGDFGLEQGGAAGLELDWYDPNLGSPAWAHVVASSEGHSRLMLEVRENGSLTVPYMGGDLDANVRADIVYFKTASDGAVFSTSSIAWCGALSHNNYDNNVSRIMRNVVERFTSDKPLP